MGLFHKKVGASKVAKVGKFVDVFGADPETRRKGREARRELKASIRPSDFVLVMILIGFSIGVRFSPLRDEWDVLAGAVLVLASFLGYLGLRAYEDKQNSPLRKLLDAESLD